MLVPRRIAAQIPADLFVVKQLQHPGDVLLPFAAQNQPPGLKGGGFGLGHGAAPDIS